MLRQISRGLKPNNSEALVVGAKESLTENRTECPAEIYEYNWSSSLLTWGASLGLSFPIDP
jgi:hypothetical protein